MFMLETIITVGIVVVVAVLAGRSFYRTMTGKNDRCNCPDNCQSCTYENIMGTHQKRDAEK